MELIREQEKDGRYVMIFCEDGHEYEQSYHIEAIAKPGGKALARARACKRAIYEHQLKRHGLLSDGRERGQGARV